LVSVRRMFGGAGIYRDGLMFALVSSGEIYLKADKETEERFRAAGSRPFVYRRDGKSATMAYWSAPDAALDDRAVMRDWAELAFAAALRAPRPKRRVLPEIGGDAAPARRSGRAKEKRGGRAVRPANDPRAARYPFSED
jgi:DNA transformation protein